jgi:hypothetical protein
VNKTSYGCGTRHHGGDAACDNAFMMRRTDAEARYINGVQKEFRDPDVRRARLHAITKTLAAAHDGTEAQALRAELVEVTAEVERVAVMMPNPAEIEAEWDELVNTLGEFTKMLPTRSQVEAAWASVRSYIGPDEGRPARQEPRRSPMFGSGGWLCQIAPS